MNTPQPFIYQPGDEPDPTDYPVNVLDVRNIVQNGGHCHQFRVNPEHQSPSLAWLQGMIGQLKFGPEDGDAFLIQESLRQALASAETGKYGVGAVLAHTRHGALEIVETARTNASKADNLNTPDMPKCAS